MVRIATPIMLKHHLLALYSTLVHLFLDSRSTVFYLSNVSFLAMGFSKMFGRETQDLHFERDSIPLQSAISWTTTADGTKEKLYFHVVSEPKTNKGAVYTRKL